MIDLVSKMLAPLQRKVALMVTRAIVKAAKDDGLTQLLQLTLLAEETKDNIEHLQEYGFTSVPLPGAEGLALAVGGNRKHLVVVAVGDRRYRLKGLVGGETAMFTDEEDSIILRRNRELHVRSNKYKFQGANDELMDLLQQTLQKLHDVAMTLSTDTTNTMLGPRMLNAFSTYQSLANDAATIRTKLLAMKV